MSKNKTQILIIHGGETFKTRKDYLHFLKTREISIAEKLPWHGEYLKKKLGADFEIIKPRMPLQDNANYSDWEIHFERHFPYLKNDLILIGNSLGGTFLAKYLSEHEFPKKIRALYLVCPPFDDNLPKDDLAGGFRLKADLSLIEKNCQNVTLLFSEDDDVVPVAQSEKYAAKLKKARRLIFNDVNGHFRISEFPEIVRMIENDARRK